MDVKNSCRDINELSTNAQIACKLFMDECKKQELNVLITETYRSQARQDYLYAQGRTTSGKVVTWTKSSNHTGRMAWDICKNVKGQEYNDAEFFKKCGVIAKNLGITWGGNWKKPDQPHFEISSDWRKPTMELKSINDIIYRLHKEGILTNKLYWMNRMEKDSNIYAILKNMANYTLK